MHHGTFSYDNTLDGNDQQMMFITTPKSATIKRTLPPSISFQTIETESFGPFFYLNLPEVLRATTKQYPCFDDLTFDRVCIDTGSQVRVCGFRQAKSYCHDFNIPFILVTSLMRFKFGDTITPSCGIMKFRFPCPSGGSIDLYIAVVELDVPFLLDLRNFIGTNY